MAIYKALDPAGDNMTGGGDMILLNRPVHQLNYLMDFDCTILVLPGGYVDERPDYDILFDPDELGPSVIDSPETTEELARQGLKLVTGRSGQFGYSGAVFHPSEYIGGGLSEHILETPGWYVVFEVSEECYLDEGVEASEYCSPDVGCDCEPAGWAILHRPFDVDLATARWSESA